MAPPFRWPGPVDTAGPAPRGRTGENSPHASMGAPVRPRPPGPADRVSPQDAGAPAGERRKLSATM